MRETDHGLPVQPYDDGTPLRRARAPLARRSFAAYAATLGIDADAAARDFAPGEARVLLIAESIVSDGDVDLRDEYRDRGSTRSGPTRVARARRPA